VSRGGSQGVLARARARSPSVRSPSSEGDRERGDPPLAGPSVSLLPPSEGLPDRPTFRNSGLLGENINVDALAAFSFRVRLARTLVPPMGGFSLSWRGGKEGRGFQGRVNLGCFQVGPRQGARALPQYGLPLRRGIGKGGIRPWQVLRCPFSLLRRVSQIDRPFEIPDCWAKISMWTRSRRFRSVCVSHGRWSLRWGVSPCHGGGERREGGSKEG
jgi:hypothetical protein